MLRVGCKGARVKGGTPLRDAICRRGDESMLEAGPIEFADGSCDVFFVSYMLCRKQMVCCIRRDGWCLMYLE